MRITYFKTTVAGLLAVFGQTVIAQEVVSQNELSVTEVGTLMTIHSLMKAGVLQFDPTIRAFRVNDSIARRLHSEGLIELTRASGGIDTEGGGGGVLGRSR